MNRIGKHNYEAFLLDYIEGNLDEAGVNELFAFFESYPELKPESFDDLENISIDPPPIIFEGKDTLKHKDEEREESVIAYLEGQLSKPEVLAFEKRLLEDVGLLLLLNDYQKAILKPANEIAFGAKDSLKRTLIAEDSLIAYSEGILTAGETAELDKQLALDPVAKNILTAYQSTKLEADISITYPNKEGLKRRGLVIYLSEYWKPLAIAASIILLFGLFWLNKGTEQGRDLADKSEVKKNTIKTPAKGESDKDSSATNNSVVPIVIPDKTQLADKKIKINTRKDNSSPILIQKDPIAPIVQPIVNNNNQNKIDTSSSAGHPLAMVKLDKNTYLYNYYDDKDEEPVQAKKTEITTKEYVTKKLTEAAWGEQNAVTVQKDSDKKLKGFDVLALIGKGLKKLGNKKSDAKKIESENGKGSDYVVTIGGISVTRHSTN